MRAVVPRVLLTLAGTVSLSSGTGSASSSAVAGGTVQKAVQMPTEGGQDAVRKVAEWMADQGYDDGGGGVTVENASPEYVYGDVVLPAHGTNQLLIEALEGDMTAKPGDWIIKGVQGEFYPCKPDIFEATYEAAVR